MTPEKLKKLPVFPQIKKILDGDYEITIKRGIWPFWFFETYRGDCTVWHEVKTGKMAGTHLSKRLLEIWTTTRWKEIDGEKTP